MPIPLSYNSQAVDDILRIGLAMPVNFGLRRAKIVNSRFLNGATYGEGPITAMNDEQGENPKTASRRSRSDAEVLRLLSRVRLLSLDVDGVMTDGGLYYTADGQIQRKYNVKDGVGIKRVMKAGVHIAIISAGASGSIPERAATLGIEHVFTGVEDKLGIFEGLCEKLDIGLDECAHIGDDLNDVPLLEAVGCPIAVADAQPEAWAAALIITEKNGGAGAIREICDGLVETRANLKKDDASEA